jgi:hypothetical protein
MKSRLLILNGAILVAATAFGVDVTAQRSTGFVPTFNRDVAPIIFDKCVTCHRPQQVAPMSFMSYREVRPWARAIKTKVAKGEMPPWFADPRFGEFRNDPQLSEEQINTIAAWADGGALEGDTPLTAQLPVVGDGWSHPSGRPPDLLIEMANAFNAPAEGELPWFNIFQELPAELKKEEHFIEAIQIMPSVVDGVHHMGFGIKALPPGTKIGLGEAWPGGLIIPGALVDERTGKTATSIKLVRGDQVPTLSSRRRRVNDEERGAKPPNEFYYCCYVPGGTFRWYRDGGYSRLPREGVIEWSVHYSLIGKPFADKTRVGLWYQKNLLYEVKGNAGTARSQIVQGKELIDSELTPVHGSGVSAGGPPVPVIPPYTKDWAITAITAYGDDITLYTVWPHMHLRGKEMHYVLTYPDGREQVLLSVPNFDFNWQIFYELKEPLKIPAGSTIKTVGSYDNSVSNRWATEPHKEVYWSEQSWDEMYNGFRDYSIDKLAGRPPTAGQGQPAGEQ